jgi:hypothetical protein
LKKGMSAAPFACGGDQDGAAASDGPSISGSAMIPIRAKTEKRERFPFPTHLQPF